MIDEEHDYWPPCRYCHHLSCICPGIDTRNYRPMPGERQFTVREEAEFAKWQEQLDSIAAKYARRKAG